MRRGSLVSVHFPSGDEEGPYRDMNGVNTVFFNALQFPVVNRICSTVT